MLVDEYTGIYHHIFPICLIYVHLIYDPFQYSSPLSVVPHKAVAEVSKIGNLYERLVVVNHGWQSESTDGPKGGWSCVFGVAAMVAVVTWSVTSPTTAGCSVV